MLGIIWSLNRAEPWNTHEWDLYKVHIHHSSVQILKNSLRPKLNTHVLISKTIQHSFEENAATDLSSLATLPLCSSTSHTQATCSCVNPKLVIVELAAAEVGVAGPGSSPPSDPAPPPPPAPARLGKLEKLERHWPTPENAENNQIKILFRNIGLESCFIVSARKV